jgi:hypothetical protein
MIGMEKRGETKMHLRNVWAMWRRLRPCPLWERPQRNQVATQRAAAGNAKSEMACPVNLAGVVRGGIPAWPKKDYAIVQQERRHARLTGRRSKACFSQWFG